ncbi:MAG: acarbose 7IV-phosphotransferase [Gaiellales bacterium]|nr:acarbose 7IV-phosphotransferase [Gaiellales bacterium]
MRVPHLPHLGCQVTSAESCERPGGGAVGTAGWAALLGARVGVVAPADGADGVRIRSAVERTGILAAWLPGETVRCLILLTPDGERTMINQQPVPVPGVLTGDAGALLGEAAVLWSDWRDEETAAAVHRAMPGGLRATALRRFRRELAAGRDHEIVIGTGADGFLPTDAELGACGCMFCVITDGPSGGSYWTSRSGWSRFDASPLPSGFVDTCGAGDAFNAGVLVALSRGGSAEEAVRLGADTAARACCQAGTFPLTQ